MGKTDVRRCLNALAQRIGPFALQLKQMKDTSVPEATKLEPWQKFEIEWRDSDVDLPTPGMYVALTRDKVRDGEVHEIGRVYWDAKAWNCDGLFWRPVPPPNFTGIGPTEPSGPRPPIDEAFWFVVLIEPQQEVPTMWRLHEHGRELFVPVIRRRIPTGRKGKNGHRVTRIIPRPMFQGLKR